MRNQHKFGAPWSRQLKWLTAIFSAVLLLIPMVMLQQTPADAPSVYLVSIWLPLAILLLAALFAVRGYIIEGDQLLVVRPLWKTRLTLRGLEEIEVDAEAMKGSIRTFGNGGLFGFIGLFRNQRIGRYRAFVTDPARCVVLRFPERTLVISPDNPQKMVTLLQR